MAPKKGKSPRIVEPQQEETIIAEPLFDQYVDFRTGETKITSRSWAMKIGKELEEYSRKDTSFTLSPFYHEMGMRHDDFYRLLEVYKELQGFHEVSLENIGRRRELGGLLNKLNTQIVMFTGSVYSHEWKKLKKENHELSKDLLSYRAELAKEADEKQKTVFNVFMDKTPITDVVKEIPNEKRDEE